MLLITLTGNILLANIDKNVFTLKTQPFGTVTRPCVTLMYKKNEHLNDRICIFIEIINDSHKMIVT